MPRYSTKQSLQLKTQHAQSLFISVKSRGGVTHQLHVKRLWNDVDKGADAPLVVMFHGIIESGRIFYKGRERALRIFSAAEQQRACSGFSWGWLKYTEHQRAQ